MTDTKKQNSTAFEVRVDGMTVAGACGPRNLALNEARSYFYQYLKEGSFIELVEVTTIDSLISGDVNHD